MSYALVAGGWHWFPLSGVVKPGRSACGQFQAFTSQLQRDPGGPIECWECRPTAAYEVPADGSRAALSVNYWRPLRFVRLYDGRSRLHYQPEDAPMSLCGHDLASPADALTRGSLPVLCATCVRGAVRHYQVTPASLAGWSAL